MNEKPKILEQNALSDAQLDQVSGGSSSSSIQYYTAIQRAPDKNLNLEDKSVT